MRPGVFGGERNKPLRVCYQHRFVHYSCNRQCVVLIGLCDYDAEHFRARYASRCRNARQAEGSSGGIAGKGEGRGAAQAES